MSRTQINQHSSAGNEERRFKVRYLFYFSIAVLLLLSVVSYTPEDYNVIAGGTSAMAQNWIGNLGATLAHFLFLCLGLGSYVLIVLVVFGIIRAFMPGPSNRIRFLLGSGMVMFGALLMFALSPEAFGAVCEKLGLGREAAARQAIPGGVIGQVLAAPQVAEFGIGEGWIRRLIGPIGTAIVGWTFCVAGLVMIYFADFHQFVRLHFAVNPAQDEPADATNRRAGVLAAMDKEEACEEPAAPKRPGFLDSARAALAAFRNPAATPVSAPMAASAPAEPVELPLEPLPEPAAAETAAPAPAAAVEPPPPVKEAAAPRPAAAAMPPRVANNDAAPDTRITEKGETARKSLLGNYTLPPASMLSRGAETGGESLESINRSKEILQQTLDSFKVAGRVAGHISGPRVTRYEIMLDPGVNVSKFAALADNIAMNLSAKSVRILAPIPGRPAVGVEAPNSRSEAVFMRSIMESEAWAQGSAAIPIVLGRDVAGKPMVLDLSKAPHLLIAGSTGSGKSVCMNTLIMSLLFRFRPDELRLILVDPKIVEFEDYKTLPHLITPVVNDSRKVPTALRWAVQEMEHRYRILATAGVKTLAGFNQRPPDEKTLFGPDGNPIPEKMPILVVIVDELADLMMTEARKDVETSIARIAQKGRAAGIHMVIATQRPSREIVTGVIRANLPTKIAFTVSKRVDSQVILDQTGAETLLGRGDMLYLPPGVGGPERIQGAMLDDSDIKKVVKFVSDQAPQNFNSDVMSEGGEGGGEDGEGEDFDEFEEHDAEDYKDIAPLLKKYLQPGDGDNVRKALEIVILERKASTSYLQRRLGIGYNKAAELIDLFEERGIIGPQTTGGGKREVLIFDDITNE